MQDSQLETQHSLHSSESLQRLDRDYPPEVKTRHHLGLALFWVSTLSGFSLGFGLGYHALWFISPILSIALGLAGALLGALFFMRMAKLFGTWPSKVKERSDSPEKKSAFKRLKPKNTVVSSETGLCLRSIVHQINHIGLEMELLGHDFAYYIEYFFLWWRHPAKKQNKHAIVPKNIKKERLNTLTHSSEPSALLAKYSPHSSSPPPIFRPRQDRSQYPKNALHMH